MPEQISPTVDRVWYADIADAFMGYGAGADADDAFDDAVDTAWFEYGRAAAVPTVAGSDPSRISVAQAGPTTRTAALAAGRALLAAGSAEAGVVYAFAVAADSAFKRRRVTAKLDTVALTIPDVGVVTSDVSQLLAAVTGDTPVVCLDGEHVELAEVRSRRDRFKPTAVATKGKNSRQFVVLDAGRIISAGHRTAGEARRAAVEMIKSGGKSGTYTLEVVALVRREDGAAFISVERSLTAQRGALRVTFASEKNPEKTKVAGWVFCGLTS